MTVKKRNDAAQVNIKKLKYIKLNILNKINLIKYIQKPRDSSLANI